MITSPGKGSVAKVSFERSFIRRDSWRAASSDAAKWLTAMQIEHFPNLHLHLFLADSSPQADNRISRYRKMSGRSILKEDTFRGCAIVSEGYLDYSSGLLFWAEFKVSNVNLDLLIDYLRSDRGSFVFLSEQYAVPENTFVRLMELQAGGDLHRADQTEAFEWLVSHHIYPVRLWGEFDDRELWVGIYS